MATDRENTASQKASKVKPSRQISGMAEVNLGNGKTGLIDLDFAQRWGVYDDATLNKALTKSGAGSVGGVSMTVDGQPTLLFNQDSAGLRSGGRTQFGNGIFGVDPAGFAADHPNTTGAMGLKPGLLSAAALIGPILGGAALTGALGGGAAGAGGLSAETLAGIPTGFEGGLASEFTPLAGGGVAPTVGGAGATVNAGQYALPGAAGGATGGAGALAGGAVGGGTAAGGGGSILGGLLGGATTLGIPNNILGGALQGVGGYLAADKQGDAFKDVAAQQNALGAPYRDLLLKSYQPGFDLMSQPGYGDAFDKAADVAARSWSAKAGNPAGNPTAQAGILSDVWNMSYLPALANYRGGLGQFGQLGINTSGQASLLGANTTGSGWEAIGAGINTALNPQPDWNQIFKQYGLGGNQPNYALNIGGVRQS